jgi:hypothetical protein
MRLIAFRRLQAGLPATTMEHRSGSEESPENNLHGFRRDCRHHASLL